VAPLDLEGQHEGQLIEDGNDPVQHCRVHAQRGAGRGETELRSDAELLGELSRALLHGEPASGADGAVDVHTECGRAQAQAFDIMAEAVDLSRRRRGQAPEGLVPDQLDVGPDAELRNAFEHLRQVEFSRPPLIGEREERCPDCRVHLTAKGLTGAPTAPVTGMGAAVSQQS
jgi:hypothetical protein